MHFLFSEFDHCHNLFRPRECLDTAHFHKLTFAGLTIAECSFLDLHPPHFFELESSFATTVVLCIVASFLEL